MWKEFSFCCFYVLLFSSARSVSNNDCTKPGFGFQCFETFKLFQGKQKKLESQVACFESCFRETFWKNGEDKGREVIIKTIALILLVIKKFCSEIKVRKYNTAISFTFIVKFSKFIAKEQFENQYTR